jgi:chromosome partitioning protein
MSDTTPARIITVAAAKGGVGKTTLAYELAAALSGVLIDLDWDAGGATRMWGHDPTRAARAPLLDALERGPEGRPPRPKRRANQPALVPAHPDLSASRIDADLVGDCLRSWAALEAIVGDYRDYRLLLVPTMVPAVPPRRFVERLAGLAEAGRITVAPPVSEHRWIRRRLRRAALVTQPNPGVRVRAAAAEFRAVADTVEVACG